MNETVTIPKKPSPELLNSMAMRMNHAFNLPHGLTDEQIMKARADDSDFGTMVMAQHFLTTREKEMILKDMERIFDEVTGQGFYKYPA